MSNNFVANFKIENAISSIPMKRQGVSYPPLNYKEGKIVFTGYTTKAGGSGNKYFLKYKNANGTLSDVMYVFPKQEVRRFISSFMTEENGENGEKKAEKKFSFIIPLGSSTPEMLEWQAKANACSTAAELDALSVEMMNYQFPPDALGQHFYDFMDWVFDSFLRDCINGNAVVAPKSGVPKKNFQSTKAITLANAIINTNAPINSKPRVVTRDGSKVVLDCYPRSIFAAIPIVERKVEETSLNSQGHPTITVVPVKCPLSNIGFSPSTHMKNITRLSELENLESYGGEVAATIHIKSFFVNNNMITLAYELYNAHITKVSDSGRSSEAVACDFFEDDEEEEVAPPETMDVPPPKQKISVNLKDAARLPE